MNSEPYKRYLVFHSEVYEEVLPRRAVAGSFDTKQEAWYWRSCNRTGFWDVLDLHEGRWIDFPSIENYPLPEESK